MQEIEQKREQRLRFADMGKKYMIDITQTAYQVAEYRAHCTFQVDARILGLAAYVTSTHHHCADTKPVALHCCGRSFSPQDAMCELIWHMHWERSNKGY